MQARASYIEHDGVVSEIANGQARIKIIQGDSCDSCALGGYCSTEQIEDRFYDLHVLPIDTKTGDLVKLRISNKNGMRAAFWSYIMPFIVIMFVLTGGVIFQIPETTSGLMALAVLVPYYLFLNLIQKHISKQFHTEIFKS